jgi:hypothetical protein
MMPSELEHWLSTDESQGVGQKSPGGESLGHDSGRKIVEILRAKKSDLTRRGRNPHAQGRRLRPPAPGTMR